MIEYLGQYGNARKYSGCKQELSEFNKFWKNKKAYCTIVQVDLFNSNKITHQKITKL